MQWWKGRFGNLKVKSRWESPAAGFTLLSRPSGVGWYIMRKEKKMWVRMVSASATTFTKENCIQSLRCPDKNMWFKESTLDRSFLSLPPQGREYHGWIDFLHEEEISFSLVSLPRMDRSRRSRRCLLFPSPAWPQTACSPRHTPANWGFHPWSCVLGL